MAPKDPSPIPPLTTSTNTDTETFTPMSLPDTDLESIGAHCQLAYCHVLDFLPFRCDSCHGTFCLDHRSETAHKCPKAGEWARNRNRQTSTTTTASAKTNSMLNTTGGGRPTVVTGTQCSHPSCKTLINTLSNPSIHCTTCNRNYCLKHRLVEDHACKTLTPLGARPANAASRLIPITSPKAQTEKAKAAFSKLRAWSKEKTTPAPKPPAPNSAAARTIAVNNLKKTAKGLDSIPLDKRLYLHVEAEAATTTSKFPKADLFFHAEWSVGRVLDEAAKRLQVENVNNRARGEVERLRVYFVEGGRLLEFSEKLGESVRSGNTVVLLRGVGPAVPDLIEV
jgi:AN1-type zinc finger protein 1